MSSAISPLIAIVDDDLLFAELIETVLSEEGFRTITCADAEWAYDLIARVQPDMVLLDIRMHTPTAGWDVLELLRLDSTTAQLPVIICSADQSFLARHEKKLRATGCAMLLKPFDLDELLSQIVGLLPSSCAIA